MPSWQAGAGPCTRPSACGGALAVFKSETYNGARTAIAPLPLATWETRSVTFNFVYLPKVREINSGATVGFWLTLWLGSW